MQVAGKGGVIRFTARSDGADAQVAILPFLIQRWAVRAAEIVANSPSENVRAYDEQVRQIITSLTSGFASGTVNPVMSHLTCIGGVFGGGERPAQSIFDTACRRPSSPSRHITWRSATRTGGRRCHPCPCTTAVHRSRWTSASRTTRASCAWSRRRLYPCPGHRHPAHVGAATADLRGTLAELEAQAASFGEDYLRVWLCEPTRAGLRDDTVAILPNALEVRIDPEFAGPSVHKPTDPGRSTRTPAEFFAEYCKSKQVSDARLAALFGELHDQVTAVSAD